ncbi:MAG: hypothetical protein KF708_19150 [Pirellulales bacterium]|nr:hypothetical protein [Pirellulales bacterium]
MRHRLARLVLCGLVVCCSVTVAMAASPAAIPDTPFEQDYREPFLQGSTPEHSDVHALTLDRQGRLWVASRGGIAYYAENEWHTPHGAELNGPAYDVAVDDAGTVWVGAWNGFYRYVDDRWEQVDEVVGPISAIGVSPERMIVAGPHGFWERKSMQNEWQPLDLAVAKRVRDILINGDEWWFATGVGAYRVADGQTRCLSKSEELASSNALALARDAQGQVWIGSSGGIDLYRGDERVGGYRPSDGLPAAFVNEIAFDRKGRAWVGTQLGVARYDGQRWAVRHSERWLPNNSARAIAFDESGAALVGTGAGISTLKSRPMTLADKAAHYGAIVRARHVREPGLVERCDLRAPGDLSTWYAVDTDNDGMYTGLYVATEAYRYAVTKDPTALENARAAYRAMEFLQTVTDTPGFVARTVIPADWTEMADANRTHTPQEIARLLVDDPREKVVDVRWRKSADGRWLWKGDTSSDEITGHFFAYAIYYDLVADEPERARVRKHVARIMDYLIAGDYDLLDIDGKPTMWGVWSPKRLNGDPAWRLDRGVNSTEILSFLKVTHHMTGEPKYEAAAEKLLTEHGYAQNVIDPLRLDPGAFTYIDVQLAALAYRALLDYEQDPQRRKSYLQGVENWFQPVRRDHSPLYGFVYSAITGTDGESAGCVEFLRQVPLDLIDWTVDNHAREDVTLVRSPVIDHWQTSRLLPPDERRVGKWDGNPYSASGGHGSRTESSTVYWLLPYWMGRYHEFIGPPAEGPVAQ